MAGPGASIQLRLNEAAHLSRSEVQDDLITIPASRMKGKEGRAREHLVPLSGAAKEAIASLLRYRGGSYLFSFNAGKSPLNMTGAIKALPLHANFRQGLRWSIAMQFRKS